jgi:hypothetical protein
MLTAPRRSSTSKIAPVPPIQSLSGEDEFTNSETKKIKKKPSKSSLPSLSTKSNPSSKTAPYVLPGQISLSLPSVTRSCVDLDPVVAEQINRAIKLVDRNGTGVVSYTGQ